MSEDTELDAERRLRIAIMDPCWIATAVGFDDEGDVRTYAVPAGRVHALVAAAQSASIPAHLRTIDPPKQVIRPATATGREADDA